MNVTAFVLVVAAAGLHAGWNLTAKRVSGNLGVFWLGLCRFERMPTRPVT